MSAQLLEGLKRLLPLIIVGVAGTITSNVDLLQLTPETAFIVVTVVGSISAIAWSLSDQSRAQKGNVQESDVGYKQIMAYRKEPESQLTPKGGFING